MRPSVKVFWTLLILWLFSPSAILADTVYLKTGRQVQGRIIEETKDAVRILVGKDLRTFYRGDILKLEREGEKPAPAGPGPLTARKRELVRRLLEANAARENMNLIFSQIISQAPEEARPRLKEILRTDEIIERLVPIYAQHYTEEELTELINFYKSPTGSKHLRLTPQIVDETMNAAVVYFKEKAAAEKP